MTKIYQAQNFLDTQNCLGEGAFWHPERNTFMWVDIEEKKIFEYHETTNHIQNWNIGKRVSLIRPSSNPNILNLAVQGGIISYDLRDSSMEWICEVEKSDSNIRTNDGNLAPDGKLWIGTMSLDAAVGKGNLYCIENNKAVLKINELSIPNGICWSKDEKRMYFIDSLSYAVKSYLYDKKSNNIEFETNLITIPKSLGLPDGMCQDKLGNLWVAIWGGASVLQINAASGEIISKVDVPAPQVTSCVFNPSQDKLYITSARVGLSREDLLKYPLSGNVFLVKF